MPLKTGSLKNLRGDDRFLDGQLIYPHLEKDFHSMSLLARVTRWLNPTQKALDVAQDVANHLHLMVRLEVESKVREMSRPEAWGYIRAKALPRIRQEVAIAWGKEHPSWGVCNEEVALLTADCLVRCIQKDLRRQDMPGLRRAA